MGKPAAQGSRVSSASERSTSALEYGVVLVAVGEVAEDDAAHALEDASEPQVGPHAVQAVGALADVLEEEHGAVERGHVRRAEQPGDKGEVAANERALGDAGDVGGGADERRWRLGGLEEAEEALLDVRGLLAELGEDGPVDGDAADGPGARGGPR